MAFESDSEGKNLTTIPEENEESHRQGNSLDTQDSFHGGQTSRYVRQEAPNPNAFVFSMHRMIDGLTRLVLTEDLPFKIAEDEKFENFARSLQPEFRKVSESTIKYKVVQIYKKYKKDLTSYFLGFDDSRVTVALDRYTSITTEDFLCITAFWIDESWLLQKRIIAFDAWLNGFPGFDIKKRILKKLKKFELSAKIFSIPLDHAIVDTEGIECLKSDLSCLMLDGLFLHDRYCAHILNLCVQEGLNALDDLVKPIRKIVQWIRCSQERKDAFIKYCEQSDLEPTQLFLDFPNHWRATYEFLVATKPYEQILMKMYIYDQSQGLDDCVDDMVITNADWVLAGNLISVLACFDDVADVFSYVYVPNVHLMIQEYVKIVDMLSEYENAPSLTAMIYTMKRSLLDYVLEFPYIYAIATALDPRIKLDGLKSLLEFYYSKLDIHYEIDAYVDQVKKYLYQLHNIYSSMHTSRTQEASVRSSSGSSYMHPLISRISTKARFDNASSSNGFSDLEDYLSCDFHFRGDFSILTWWKHKAEQFPTLARIAKDVFAVPASTIASDSIFYTGRRVLDEKRSTLPPEFIKKCVCTKDWIQAEKRVQDRKIDYYEEKPSDDDSDAPEMGEE